MPNEDEHALSEAAPDPLGGPDAGAEATPDDLSLAEAGAKAAYEGHPDTASGAIEHRRSEDTVESPFEAERSESAGAGSPADADADADAEDEDEDEDDEGADELEERFLPGDWYVIHTYSGYENKVRANLGSRTQSMNMEDKIFDVVVPTEEVMELKSGRKQLVQKKVFPGYILVRMELDDDSWYVVRNTPGVTGFVGAGAKPTPLSAEEASKILVSKPAERARPALEFEMGDVVRVTSGPFQNMSGPISEINTDQQKVKVLVDIFGRETPVELSFDQVTKL